MEVYENVYEKFMKKVLEKNFGQKWEKKCKQWVFVWKT